MRLRAKAGSALVESSRQLDAALPQVALHLGTRNVQQRPHQPLGGHRPDAGQSCGTRRRAGNGRPPSPPGLSACARAPRGRGHRFREIAGKSDAVPPAPPAPGCRLRPAPGRPRFQGGKEGRIAPPAPLRKPRPPATPLPAARAPGAAPRASVPTAAPARPARRASTPNPPLPKPPPPRAARAQTYRAARWSAPLVQSARHYCIGGRAARRGRGRRGPGKCRGRLVPARTTKACPPWCGPCLLSVPGRRGVWFVVAGASRPELFPGPAPAPWPLALAPNAPVSARAACYKSVSLGARSWNQPLTSH